MAKSRTLANLRSRWPNTRWRITETGGQLPRVRWEDGPSEQETYHLLLNQDPFVDHSLSRTLSNDCLRTVAEDVLASRDIAAEYLPPAEFARTDDAVLAWTIASGEVLATRSLLLAGHYRSRYGLNGAARAEAYHRSFYKESHE